MIGHLDKSDFKPDQNYDTFYAGHRFEPFPESLALTADEVLPRVGWALDVGREIGVRHVLDLCCLDGFASLTLASKLGCYAQGVDLSEPGVELANQRAETNGLNASYKAMAIEGLKGYQKYDLILLFEAIEHFTDVDAVMNVIKENLEPGGTLLVSTPDAEGTFGIGNDDACHLRIYSHRTDLGDLSSEKPLISLPAYLETQGFDIISNDVWNDLIHTRAVLR